MSFDEENLELEDASYSPSSVSRISTHVTDAALVLKNEIKGNCWPLWLKVFGFTRQCFSLELSVEACTDEYTVAWKVVKEGEEEGNIELHSGTKCNTVEH